MAFVARRRRRPAYAARALGTAAGSAHAFLVSGINDDADIYGCL
jgi:hypothetical protein